MKNLTILLTLIIVLFSCKQKKELDNIVDLTSITEPNVTNLSELGSEITYIPLETNAGCFITQIDKLIYEGGSYFLGSININYELPEKGSTSHANDANKISTLPILKKRKIYLPNRSRRKRAF